MFVCVCVAVINIWHVFFIVSTPLSVPCECPALYPECRSTRKMPCVCVLAKPLSHNWPDDMAWLWLGLRVGHHQHHHHSWSWILYACCSLVHMFLWLCCAFTTVGGCGWVKNCLLARDGQVIPFLYQTRHMEDDESLSVCVFYITIEPRRVFACKNVACDWL